MEGGENTRENNCTKGGEKFSGGWGWGVARRREEEDAWVRDQEPPARQARDTLVRSSFGFSGGGVAGQSRGKVKGFMKLSSISNDHSPFACPFAPLPLCPYVFYLLAGKVKEVNALLAASVFLWLSQTSLAVKLNRRGFQSGSSTGSYYQHIPLTLYT